MSEEKATNNEVGKDKEGKGGNNNKVIIICAIVIILLLLVLIFVLVGRKPQTVVDNSNSGDAPAKVERDVLVNEENIDKVLEEIVNEKPVEEGYFAVTMNSTWNFVNGDATSDNAYVENKETNTSAVYFDLYLKDTEEVIYESPIMPVGTVNNSIKLNKHLDAGTYECVCAYYLVDSEGVPTGGNVNLTVKVIVEN